LLWVCADSQAAVKHAARTMSCHLDAEMPEELVFVSFAASSRPPGTENEREGS
jgi:hypothetical protein